MPESQTQKKGQITVLLDSGDGLDLIIDHRGRTPKKLGGDWSEQGVPVLSGKHIKDGRIIKQGELRYVDEGLYKRWMREGLQEGDVILTSEAPLGELYFVKEGERYCLGQRLFALRVNNEVLDPQFLYYFLKSQKGRHELMRRISGTAAQGIRQEELRKVEVEAPSLETQKRIASILSAFDDKIEVNNRINAKLEEMAQAIFREWFVRNQNSNLRIQKLGQVVDFKYGKALKESDREGGDVAVFGSSGIVGWHNKKLVSGPGIVVGRKGNSGSVMWVDQDFHPIDTTFYVETGLPLTFCYYLLKQQDFQGGDSAVPGLNRDIALQNEILLPDEELIREFDELVAPMFEKMYKGRNENQKLAEARDALLPKLMSGEIQV